MKEIELHTGQHLYCDFDQSGIGDTCLFCGGDVRFVTYAPCPKGFVGKLVVREGEHLMLPGEDKCLACGQKDGSCPLDPEMIYCQY